MKHIKILGPGCLNCQKVEANTHQALERLHLSVQPEISKITDPLEISQYILHTPGLVVDEVVICEGRVPGVEEIVGWLNEAVEKA